MGSRSTIDRLSFRYQPRISMTSGELYGAQVTIGSLGENEVESVLETSTGDDLVNLYKSAFYELILDLKKILQINGNLIYSFAIPGIVLRDQNLLDFIIGGLSSNRDILGNFEIAISESKLFKFVDSKEVEQLNQNNISVAINNFGIGSSLVNDQSKFRIKAIGINADLVNGIFESTGCAETLQTCLRTAHQLDIRTVAEGIKDKYTYMLLQSYGCKIGQGSWISEPLCLSDFIAYIESQKIIPPFPMGVLYMAQLDHIQWRKNLIDVALYLHSSHRNEHNRSVLGALPELNHAECKLGKWYYASGNIFGHLDEYKDLEKPHEDLHTIGKELLRAVNRDCSYKELKRLINKLSSLSVVIIHLLQALENHWVLAEHIYSHEG